MTHLLKAFIADESGATAVEYCLIVSLISLAIVGSAREVGERLRDTFYEVAHVLDSCWHT